MTTPTTWASCLWCAFSYDDTQPTRLRDHLDGHIRALRDELQVAAMRHREMREQQLLAGEALVGAGRELLDGAS
jgi:hypothetical protein